MQQSALSEYIEQKAWGWVLSYVKRRRQWCVCMCVCVLLVSSARGNVSVYAFLIPADNPRSAVLFAFNLFTAASCFLGLNWHWEHWHCLFSTLLPNICQSFGGPFKKRKYLVILKRIHANCEEAERDKLTGIFFRFRGEGPSAPLSRICCWHIFSAVDEGTRRLVDSWIDPWP